MSREIDESASSPEIGTENRLRGVGKTGIMNWPAESEYLAIAADWSAPEEFHDAHQESQSQVRLDSVLERRNAMRTPVTGRRPYLIFTIIL